eukprot:2931579-Amphidinium_carterae.1
MAQAVSGRQSAHDPIFALKLGPGLSSSSVAQCRLWRYRACSHRRGMFGLTQDPMAAFAFGEAPLHQMRPS